MPSEFAFNWRPGVLEWLLVVELVVLLTMGLYRYVAALLGRTAPTDPLVIFYHVFWRAFRTPRRYPIPVNYQPVPPRKPKVKVDDAVEGTGLTDDELEALMAGAADADGPPPGGAPADQENLGGTRQVLLEVTIVPAPQPGIRGLRGGRVLVGADLPPDDGRANQLAIRHVCTLLRVQPHQVAIQAGHGKADKTLRVSGLSADELADRLAVLGRDSEATLGFRAGS